MKHTKSIEMITKNFSAEEMQCRHCGELRINFQFMELLQNIRDRYSKPMHVNSGYRCKTHNTAVGSKPSSYHRKGRAVDIPYSNGYEGYELVKYAIDCGMLGILIYEDFIHLDNRSFPYMHWMEKNAKK